jgi:hypothetical protein
LNYFGVLKEELKHKHVASGDIGEKYTYEHATSAQYCVANRK